MAYENLTDQLAILRRQDLSATERFVAIVAISFRNAETGRCNPPVYSDDAEKETLCSRSGYTKQCITKTLAALESKHVIVLKKHVARPSEITFTVNDVYGKQELPSTTITDTVNNVYGEGKRRLPITDKEQIKNRQEYFSHENRFWDGDADLHGGAEVHPLCDFGGEVYPENGGVSEPDLFDGEKMGSSNNSSKSSSKTERSLADLDEETGLKSSSNKDNAPADDAEQKPEKAKRQKVAFCTTERPDDVDPDLWNDFITHRRAKKAPVTETVIKRMRSAAAECQMTLSQAMEITVVRGWQGFEARYVLKDRVGKAAEKKLPPHKDPAFKFDDDYYSKVNPDNPWEGI